MIARQKLLSLWAILAQNANDWHSKHTKKEETMCAGLVSHVLLSFFSMVRRLKKSKSNVTSTRLKRASELPLSSSTSDRLSSIHPTYQEDWCVPLPAWWGHAIVLNTPVPTIWNIDGCEWKTAWGNCNAQPSINAISDLGLVKHTAAHCDPCQL